MTSKYDLRNEKQCLLLSTARHSQTLARIGIGDPEYRKLKELYDSEIERISEINQELSK